MDIGYIDFKELMRRLKREERDRVCQWFKSQLASFLPSTKIGKLDTLEKLAKMKASKSRETGKKWQEFIIEAILDLHKKGISGRRISGKRINYIFGHRSEERELYGPLERYFKKNFKKCQVLRAYEEPVKAKIQLEDGRTGSIPDLLVLKKRTRMIRQKRKKWRGLRTEWFYRHGSSDELMAVDAKTAPKELQRFHSQLTYYQAVADRVYLAATTKLILDVGQNTLVNRQLKPYGVGLIHVDMTNRENPCEIKLESRKSKGIQRARKEALISRCFPE